MKLGRKLHTDDAFGDGDFAFITDAPPTDSPPSDAPTSTPGRKAGVALVALAALLLTTSAAWFTINKLGGKQPDPLYIAEWLPEGYKPFFRDGPVDKDVAKQPRSRVLNLHDNSGQRLSVWVQPKNLDSYQATHWLVEKKPFPPGPYTFVVRNSNSFGAGAGSLSPGFSAEAQISESTTVVASGPTETVAAQEILKYVRVTKERVPIVTQLPNGWREIKANDTAAARTVTYKRNNDQVVSIMTIRLKALRFDDYYPRSPGRKTLNGRNAQVHEWGVEVDFGDHFVVVQGPDEVAAERIASSLRLMGPTDEPRFTVRSLHAIGSDQVGGKLVRAGRLIDGTPWRVVEESNEYRSYGSSRRIGLVGVPGASTRTISNVGQSARMGQIAPKLDRTVIAVSDKLGPRQVSVTRNGITTTAEFIPESIIGSRYAFLPIELNEDDTIDLTTYEKNTAGTYELATKHRSASDFDFLYNPFS